MTRRRKVRKLSVTHKRRISKALKGRALTPEHKAAISESLKGRSLTLSHRDAISKAKRNKRIRYPSTRKTSSIEGNMARSVTLKERYELVKEGVLPARTLSLEARHRISLANHARWEAMSPAQRAKVKRDLLNATLDRGLATRLRKLEGGEK